MRTSRPASASRSLPTRPRRRDAAAARRHRDVRRQGAPRRRRGLRARRRTATARARLALIGELRRALEQRRARRPLPAEGDLQHRAGRRRRGARALAAPAARARRARRLHPAGREHRPDRPADDRACSTTRSRRCATGTRRGLRPRRRRQPVDAQPARPRLPGVDLATARAPRASRRTRLELEITESMIASDPERALEVARRSCARSACALVARRLRHRLLVAGLPARPAGRAAQDRPLVRAWTMADEPRRRGDRAHARSTSPTSSA